MIALTLKLEPAVPLEAEVVSPDVLSGLDHAAIRALPVRLGRRPRRLDDFFEVEGEASDEVTVRGDVRKVKWLGQGMTRGRLVIDGTAGMHLGAHMKGGVIDVSGDVGDWLGAHMAGGTIRVRGNAGGQVGAAYRGAQTGMTDGTIVIHGSAGLEVGMRMKRGTIAVLGPVRDFAGLQMKGGTIVLGEGAELRTGAWMTRGTIVSLTAIDMLPTFVPASTYHPNFMRVFARYLAVHGVVLRSELADGVYRRYTGDTSVPGRGEILVWGPR